jgi:hypothetical protein
MERLPHCWGVGLARTGNTSFCAGLQLLGYDRVQQDPTFEALRDLRGGSGNMVVLHFKYLDYVFPGSKFVLTTRSVESWLSSMERSQQHNPRRIAGEHERIARRMAIYESVGYEQQTLADAFERHHAEVRRYFARRADDLLELNVAGGQGWDRLCPFLGVGPPTEAFPALNQGVAA